jgi:hypothetical protein
MRKLFLIVANLLIVSAIVVAAYAITISHSYSTSVKLVTPGLQVYSTCTSSGPANPVTTLALPTLQVGGTTSVTLYVTNTVNGTVTLASNSTITSASPHLSDSWTITNYLLATNCTGVAPNYGGTIVNGATLLEGDVFATTYTVTADASITPGHYSWTLNLGVQ